jgi:hypothetical protein
LQQTTNTIITPIASLRTRNEFEKYLQSDASAQIRRIEANLLASAKSDSFLLNGFCIPCNHSARFLVDMKWGGQKIDGSWIPNWRERLECPSCKMNNRQRLMAALIKQMLSTTNTMQVYLMEQVTPIYKWAAKNFDRHKIIGSEYLGYEYEGGTVIKGIRHEDVENLSFNNAQVDLIVSNDVFEHVPNPSKAFSECARVLKPGGVMLATIPFHDANELTVVRAKLQTGQLEELLPSVFHGNPVSEKGSLVFTDFGWNFLDQVKAAGFSKVNLEIYSSEIYGHLGGGQIVFRFERPLD